MLGVDPQHRRYPRFAAPVFYRSEGINLIPGYRRVTDVSLNGMRVYSDQPLTPGRRLELSLFLPGGVELVLSGQVAWVRALDEASPSPFDIGIQFTEVAPADLPRLSAVLDRGTAEAT